MKILVCGGRCFDERDFLFRALDRIDIERGPVDVVVHGGASGADSLAGQWASKRGRHEAEYRADWRTHGRAAGPIRNQQMIDLEGPQLVVAFPGGMGTRDMVRRARRNSVEVIEVEPDQ